MHQNVVPKNILLQPHNLQISYLVQLQAYRHCSFAIVIYSFFKNYGTESYRKEEVRKDVATSTYKSISEAISNNRGLRIETEDSVGFIESIRDPVRPG